MVIYNWSIQTLQMEISSSMTAQVSQYFTGLEQEFRRIQNLQLDSLSDANLNTLAAIPDSLNAIERMDKILAVQQRLNAIRNSSAYIEEVHAYIPAIRKDISGLSVSELDHEVFAEFMNVTALREAQVVSVRGDMHMVAAYPYLMPGNKREPIVIVTIKLSLDKLRDALQTMRTSPEEGLIFSSTQFKTITTSSDALLQDKIIRQVAKGQGANPNARVIKIDGQRFLTVNRSSEFFGGTLIKYVPEKAVFQPLQKFRNWFLLFAAVSLVIILLYSLFM
jgi:two-component system sensor histidine kinase YesM